MSVISLTSLIDFVESVFGRGHLSRNNNFDVRCPICNPSDSGKKKLSILLPDCKVHCWVCGFKARNLVPLIRKFGTMGQLAKYKEILGLSDGSICELITGEKADEYRLALPNDFCLLPLANQNNPDVRAIWRYIAGRGLDVKDAWYFKFGFSDDPRWKRRVMIPSFDKNGKLNYFAARAIDSIRKPKYDNPDVDKNPIIFNEINIDWSKRLVLCEGPFDLVKCPENSTAMLGSDLDERHELFNKILLNNTPVALALDSDMWSTKMPKLVKKLQEYDVDIVVVDVRQWGDPGNMTKHQFNEALSEAKSLNWNDMFINKLNKKLVSSLRF